VPSITDICPPITRFSAALLAEGCTNFVSSPEAMEKLCQLMMAILLAWLIVTVRESS